MNIFNGEPIDMESEQKVNILLVDDNPGNLIALETTLARTNYNLVRASSGQQALRHLLERDFAVILLDVNMPVLDGFETAGLIRGRERTQAIPIIFISATLSDEMNVFTGYSVGAVDYICSPFVPEILRAKVSIFVELFMKAEKVKQQAKLLRDVDREFEQVKHLREIETLRIKEEHLKEEHLKREMELEIDNGRALATKARELERSNIDLEQFAYVASHDLQEPLRAVVNNCQALEEKYRNKLDPEDIEYLDLAVGGAKRMQLLVHGLLEYSRVHMGAAVLERFEGAEVMKEVIQDLQSQIKEAHAEMICDRLPELFGNKLQFGQLLHNLIGNALKFCNGNSPLIHVGIKQQSDGTSVFFVKDNGIGIDSRHFERIFVIFQSLHARNKYSGSGLGLAICKKIVERQSGKIWVESEPGKGTTFFFTLGQQNKASEKSAIERSDGPPEMNAA